MSPSSVNHKNEREVFHSLYGATNLREYLLRQMSKPRMKIGDSVRKRYIRNPFDKGYYPNWSDEVYTISKVNKNVKRPYYEITDASGTKADRRFYSEDLQEIDSPVYRIEKILGRRKSRDGSIEYRVKWLNHSARYNSWIPAASVQDMRV